MSQSTTPTGAKTGVFHGVTFYHWLVVLVASFGWLFDCMDQRLFTLAKESALKELLGNNAEAQAAIKSYLNYAVAAMMIGWGTGGIIFGMLSDKWGRVKTMMATLLIYSGFTGLSGFAHGWLDFTIYRFLVGLGVGGMFGAATTLVAESVPGGFRAMALGSLQALSAIGNITGTYISMHIQPGGEAGAWFSFLPAGSAGWRALFFVGIVPALIVAPMVLFLREPAAWKAAKSGAAGAAKSPVGSIFDLLRHPRWRKNTLVGMGLGVAGMVGLWGIGFFSPELVTSALQTTPLAAKDFLNPPALVASLKTPANAAVAHVKNRLTPALRQRIETASTPISEALTPEVLAEFNQLIASQNLYDETAFQSVNLSKSTRNLISKVAHTAERGDVTFLNRQLLEHTFPGLLAPIQRFIDSVRSRGILLQDIGSLTGMVVFTFVASYLNRRKAFLGAFLACLATTAYVFYSLRTESDAYWMLPMMGFAQLALFAGYSIYFPELYPTRLRGTGVGLCYNAVRFLTVPFNFLMAELSKWLSFRTAAIILSAIYILGIVTLYWAPETKDQPLPED